MYISCLTRKDTWKRRYIIYIYIMADIRTVLLCPIIIIIIITEVACGYNNIFGSHIMCISTWFSCPFFIIYIYTLYMYTAQRIGVIRSKSLKRGGNCGKSFLTYFAYKYSCGGGGLNYCILCSFEFCSTFRHSLLEMWGR